MKRVLILIFFCGIGSYANAAQRFQYYAMDLRSECNAYLRLEVTKDPYEGFGGGLCYGKIATVLDALALNDGEAEPSVTDKVCLPDRLQTNDAVHAVSKWLNANQDKAKMPGYLAVVLALADAYKCAK